MVKFLYWLYFVKLKKLVQIWNSLLIITADTFSIKELVRTLFYPWRRDIIKPVQPTLQQLFEIWSLNLMSRLIGAFIRTVTILTGLVSMVAISVFIMILIVLAIGLPIIVIVSIIFSISSGLDLPIILLIAGLNLGLLIYLVSNFSYDSKYNPVLPEPLVNALADLSTGQKVDLEPYLEFEARKIYLKSQSLNDLKKNLLTSSKALFVFSRLNLSHAEIISQTFNQVSEKDFLEKAGELALIYKHRLIKTGDLILALYFFDQSFQKVIEEHGLDSNDLQIIYCWQNDFWKQLKHKNDLTDTKNLKLTGGVGKNWASGYTPFLDQVGRDLTLSVSGSTFDLHHYAHQKNIDEIERILSRTGNKNVVLVGPDGVGKKTSVLGFARRVLLGKTLAPLVFKKVIEINLSSVLSGNDSGEKLIRAINEAISAGNIILFIESVERLFDRENSVGAINAAPALLSAFRSNQIQVIATTTPASWTKMLNTDPGINEIFETIEIGEPNQLEVIKILTDITPYFESSSNVIFSYQAIKAIIDAASRYLASESFPQKGIKLIDEISTEANRQQIRRIDDKFVSRILSDKFSAPVGKVQGDEAEKLLHIEDRIHERVVNQKKAISAIANALKRSRSGLSNPNKPIGSFLFLGPTGVGKTETAKALAEFYYESEKNMLRFDMSEFQTISSIAQIIGNPETGEGGRLSNAVREKPYSLILFDEIEKAHPNLLNLFLQILDEGFITDALNQKINFANTIIIATSNAGANLIRQTINQSPVNLDMEQLSKNLVEYLQDREIFKPEFINRFDSIVAFRPLNHEELMQVTDILLAKLNQNLQSKFISIKLTDEARNLVAQIGFDPKFGARALQRAIQDSVSNIVADAILKGQAKPHQEFVINAQMIKEKMI